MSTEWDDLARLAEAATPGPWEVDDDDCGYASPDAPMVATPWVGGRRTHIVGSPARPHGKPLPENAEFIAAANPATILRLIRELQQQRHRTAEFQTIAAGFANRAVAAEDRLAAIEVLAVKWDDLPCVCGYVVPNGNDDRTQCLSCASVDLRAALAAPTDTTKETP